MADGGDQPRRGRPADAPAGAGRRSPATGVVGSLDPVLRAYAWGSHSAIPSFLGLPENGGPVAEAWFGAHSSAPSRFHSPSTDEPLTDLIEGDPVGMLGAQVAERYGGTLPFLVKLIAAAQPLSIQVHPSAAQASAGFERERAAGVPVDAPGRLYRDPMEKPEVIIALEPFDMLCGFREPSDTAALIVELGASGLLPLAEVLATGGAGALRGATEQIRGLDSEGRRQAIESLVGAAGGITDGPGAGACRWLARLGREHPADIGVLFALLMNHRRLEALEACFLPARTLHAYLHGTGVEVMGNSDNVMRAGLTPKPVALDELVEVLDFTPTQPPVLAGPGEPEPGRTPIGAWSYPVPTAEFAVDLLAGAAEVMPRGPEVLVAIAGGSSIDAEAGGSQEVPRGTAIFVGGGVRRYRLTGDGTVVRVHVGAPT